jgi:REP element-mobilizing transposase RayT
VRERRSVGKAATPRRNTPEGYPLAYFLTFTTYGSWLHGDDRGSVDGSHNRFDALRASPNEVRRSTMRRHMKGNAVVLDAPMRETVEAAIRNVCAAKDWALEAINVRTNHVHIVVAATESPERVLTTFKAWATRRCRDMSLLGPAEKLWTRHGSTRYLWAERDIDTAARYVVEGQGDSLLRADRSTRMSDAP